MELLIRNTSILKLNRLCYSIGRDDSNDIIVSCKLVSRFAAILLFDGNWILIDGNPLKESKSKNGVFVNKSKIDIQKLANGDLVQFSANFWFKVFDDSAIVKDEKSTIENLFAAPNTECANPVDNQAKP